jgi:hypothetical protein
LVVAERETFCARIEPEAIISTAEKANQNMSARRESLEKYKGYFWGDIDFLQFD